MSDIALVTFNDIPSHPATFKYLFLGELSRQRLRRYGARHGYEVIDRVPIDRSRPACWSKLPAVEQALRHHRWVLWADSDTLVLNGARRLEELCDPAHDLIVQDQSAWWRLIGMEQGNERFPINSGAFLIQASEWSVRLLREAYEQTRFVSHDAVWNGVGDQEAMNAWIRATPDARSHIGYVEGLQTSPRFFTRDALLMHYYGNHSTPRITPDTCMALFERWAGAVDADQPLPNDHIPFHWCCIQTHTPVAGITPHGPEHFLYTPVDLEPRRP